MSQDAAPVSLAGAAQAFDGARRLRDERLAGVALAVEQPEWVGVQSPPAVVVRQLVGAGPIVVEEPFDVYRPTLRIAYRVDRQRDVGDPHGLQQAAGQLDDFGVDGRVRLADHFDPELVELAVAAGLGAVVPEEGAGVVEPHGLGQVVHAVLEIGPADGRRALGTQGQQVAAAVLEGVGLVLDDVGDLARAANEQLCVLERGRVYALVPEHGSGLVAPRLEVAPEVLVLGQYVNRPSRGAERPGSAHCRRFLRRIREIVPHGTRRSVRGRPLRSRLRPRSRPAERNGARAIIEGEILRAPGAPFEDHSGRSCGPADRPQHRT